MTLKILRGYSYYFFVSTIVYFFAIVLGGSLAYKTHLTLHPKSLSILSIFFHNVEIGSLLIGVGIFSFGIGNTLLLLYNGAMVGISLKGVFNSYGLQPLVSGVAPHFFIETVATLICCTLGYESFRLMKIIKRNSKSDGKEQLHIKGSVMLFMVSVGLYLIAAIIESKISNP
nr:stage II sporulation protein M [Fredinandcohnia onubensis]